MITAGRFAARPYRDQQDLRDMQALVTQGRSLTGDWRHPHVGELMWSFFMVLCHLDPGRHICLWHGAGGGLVAYALLGEDPSFDWQVLPEWEWSGIEEEALAWAETTRAGLCSQDPDRWGGGLASGAREDDGRRISFLEQHGFRYSGEFAEVNLLRSLCDPVPASVPPPGWQVRPVAGAGEVAGRAAAQREVWSPWTVGNVSDDDYLALMQLPGYLPDLDLVAVAPERAIAAYANGWLDPVNRIGDFGPVGALPAYRRRGLTRALLVEGLRRMRAAGMDRACVSTGVTNDAARGLYESVGFRVANRYLDFVGEAVESRSSG